MVVDGEHPSGKPIGAEPSLQGKVLQCTCGRMPKLSLSEKGRYVLTCACGREARGKKYKNARKSWDEKVRKVIASPEYQEMVREKKYEAWLESERKFAEEERLEQVKREYGQNPTYEKRRLNNF